MLAEDFLSSSMELEKKQWKHHLLCRDICRTVTTAINSTYEQMFGRQFAGKAGSCPPVQRVVLTLHS